MVNFWGLTPSINLHEFVECQHCKETEAEHCSGDERHPLPSPYHVHNFLIICSGDGRHAVELLANHSKESGYAINIYMAEYLNELLARELIFLSLCCNIFKKQSVLQRTENLLEIFGNTHIRPHTQDVLKEVSQKLVSVLTESAVFPLLSITYLKSKESEDIAGVIRSWLDEKDPIDLKTMWGLRVRAHYGQRYDNRRALYDWDYNMKLPSPVSFSFDQYANWRETGLAFRFVEGRYTCPNKTICSIDYGNLPDSDTVFARTRWKPRVTYKGDISYSPYIAYSSGAVDKQSHHPSSQFHHKDGVSHVKNNVIDLIRKISLDDISSAMDRVYPMTVNGLCHKAQSSFSGYFDCIFFSHDATHLIGRFLPNTLRKDGRVVIETTKFLFNVDKTIRSKHFVKVAAELAKAGLNLQNKCDPMEQHFAVFARDS